MRERRETTARIKNTHALAAAWIVRRIPASGTRGRAAVEFDDDLIAASRTVDDLVDGHVARYHYEDLLTSVVTHLGLPKPGFACEQQPEGVLIRRGATRLVLVRATRAELLLTRATCVGDFLGDGPWAPVKRVLRPVSAPAKSERERLDTTDFRLFTELPNPTARVARRAERYSNAIRLDRNLAFGNPVLVRWERRLLLMHPVERVDGALGLAFDYTDASRRELSGVLRVASPLPVLPLHAAKNTDRGLLREAWLAVLRVFADLTTSSLTADGPPKVPKAFRPTRATVSVLSSYVIGHRRALRNPRSVASDKQRALARQAGINLPARGFTWVRPHARGAPPDQPLVFDWTPSASD